MTENEPEPGRENDVIVKRRDILTPDDILVAILESAIQSVLSNCENPHEPADVTEFLANEAP